MTGLPFGPWHRRHVPETKAAVEIGRHLNVSDTQADSEPPELHVTTVPASNRPRSPAHPPAAGDIITACSSALISGTE
jgi:hypothetical protein